MQCSCIKKVAKPELFIKNLCWVLWQVRKMRWNVITCCRDGLLPSNGMWGRNLGPDECYYQKVLPFISSVIICSMCMCIHTHTHTHRGNENSLNVLNQISSCWCWRVVHYVMKCHMNSYCSVLLCDRSDKLFHCGKDLY
jgi:hypothetical protein